MVISYSDPGNSDYGTAVAGTVDASNNSIFGSDTVFESSTSYEIVSTFDSSNGKAVIAYRDSGNSGYGTAVVFSNTGYGSVHQLSSPTVFESSNTYDTSAVYDSTNNKVVISYRDWGNSGRGTAVVGTVSGTSITFGTPVVYNSSGNTNYPSATYDSTNNKVVIAYQDQTNSYYGTAIVGTVSGTSISFGSPTVFESQNCTYISATYDSTNQKVVVAYRNGGTNYGTAKVGTVSGTSISFGSNSTFTNTDVLYVSSTFDSTNGKVVIVYRDSGNSNYGTAVIGTVSGTSISFGTSAVFESGQTNFTSATYDSTNQKVVITYQDGGNSDHGTAVVGTVSGTSISFWNSGDI